MAEPRMRAQINYEVVENIGTLATYKSGWRKELNLISWNEGKPKLDIRDWDPDHEHMSRGITLHESEAEILCDLLSRRIQDRTPFLEEEPSEGED